jgi:serine O-acetyltransferase
LILLTPPPKQPKKKVSIIFKILKMLLWAGHPSETVILYYRIACYFKYKGYRRIAAFILRRIMAVYGVYIGLNANIGYGLYLPHPTGIVIGEYAQLGKNCVIYQQVTVGLKNNEIKKENIPLSYPIIDDNAVLYSGAKVLGNIRVGKNAVVGANAVVLKDVPDNFIARGVPAKLFEKTTEHK